MHVRDGYLILTHVPYVTPQKTVALGVLACPLNMTGDIAQYAGDHTVYLQGETPCDQQGRPLRVINNSNAATLLPDLVGNHYLSSKPAEGYRDYHHKLTEYVAVLSAPARSLDPSATAQTYIVVNGDQADEVFHYQDTASSRAGISMLSAKLAVAQVAIVGLGGTGSYVFDLLVKTHIRMLHLFDGDVHSQHNAFRSPGATSLEQLQQQPFKVDHLKSVYEVQRSGIEVHAYYIDETNVDELKDMDFVFLCMEGGTVKRTIIEHLEKYGVGFIDVGLGVSLVGGQLVGQVRITASTETQRDHVWRNNRVPFPQDDEANEYDQNIQIADLNALNAALAVIKWKKLMGFYADTEHEHYSVYSVDGNHVVNEAPND